MGGGQWLPSWNVSRCGIGTATEKLEHNLAKVGVEGSNPFARSKNFNGLALRALY
jgi:hypothetical protein